MSRVRTGSSLTSAILAVVLTILPVGPTTAAAVTTGGRPGPPPATAEQGPPPGGPEITVGYRFTCTSVVANGVRCWGRNRSGQLGRGSTDSFGDNAGETGRALAPVRLGTGLTPRAVAAGYEHACALVADASGIRQVKCWGRNTRGELGIDVSPGATQTVGTRPGDMGDTLRSVTLRGEPTRLAVGGVVGCTISTTGILECWGTSRDGQLGPTTAPTLSRAIPLATGRTVRAVAVSPTSPFDSGTGHSCAILDDGTVRCWGSNGAGELGLGDQQPRGDGPNELGPNLAAVNLGAGRTATAISTGSEHSCAVLDNGKVKCWGSNLEGQLGLGDTEDRGDGPGEMGTSLPAVDLGTGRTATAIVAGTSQTCAVLDNGQVKCWGSLVGGPGPDTVGDEPGEMGDQLAALDPGVGRTVRSLAVSHGLNCAVLDDLSVKCWGGNSFGELGQGDTLTRSLTANGSLLPTVDFGLQQVTGTIRDSVTGAPVPGVLVVVVRAADYGTVATVPATDGTFSSSVPPGTYRLYLIDTLDGHHSTFWGEPDTIVVRPNETHTVAPTLAPLGTEPGSITGSVTDDVTGLAILGAVAIAVSGSGSVRTATTDSSGAFAIHHLPPGSYRLAFVSALFRTHEWWQDAADYQASTAVTVASGGRVVVEAHLSARA